MMMVNQTPDWGLFLFIDVLFVMALLIGLTVWYVWRNEHRSDKPSAWDELTSDPSAPSDMDSHRAQEHSTHAGHPHPSS